MPFEFSDHTTPAGHFYTRIDVSGQVELDDAVAFSTMLEQPKYRYAKFLSVVQSGTDYKPRARKHFQTIVDFSAIAVVTDSPLLRTAINLMIRLMHTGAGVVRFFKTEQDALAWLETQPTRTS